MAPLVEPGVDPVQCPTLERLVLAVVNNHFRNVIVLSVRIKSKKNILSMTDNVLSTNPFVNPTFQL